MSFGGFYGPTSESETMRALARALDLGVDFWDTANVYGEGVSETMIGKFLAENGSRRSRFTLATKFAMPRGFGIKRLMDLPMAWSDQWPALGLKAPAQA